MQDTDQNPASIAGILVPLMSTLRNTSFLGYNPDLDSYASPEVIALSTKLQVRINLLIDELTLYKAESLGDVGSSQLAAVRETFDELTLKLTPDQNTLLHRTMAHIYYLLNQVGGKFDFELDPQYYPIGWNGVNPLCRKTSQLMSEGIALTA